MKDFEDLCVKVGAEILDELSRGADFVQGSRYLPGGEGVNTPFLREAGVRLLHAPAISLVAGHWYTDTTNGFRAYSARFLRDERVAPFRDVFHDYELHYYQSIRAARLLRRPRAGRCSRLPTPPPGSPPPLAPVAVASRRSTVECALARV